MSKTHIMIDLETLDTVTTAVVLSIGAVEFDPYSNVLGSTFYTEIVDDIGAQQKRGRTISGGTVLWWMQQGAMAQQLFSKQPSETSNRLYTAEALHKFANFVEAHGGRDAQIWGNGADFDNIILGGLYDSFEIRKPWSYSKNRCYRTMKNLKGAPKLVRHGTHHNALDDAVTQAKHLQEIYACLNLQ